jgi:rRNA-processing protein CGR1
MGSLESRKLSKPQGKPKCSLDERAKKDKKQWEKKTKKRERLGRIRKLSKQLKDDINEEQRRVSESRKANRVRKAENEKKNMVVQKISNVKAVKKLSPKHRKAARIFLLHELN